jgi:hypothetical protein
MKLIPKHGLKIMSKRIPGVGLLIGIGFGIWRCIKGDYKNAGLEVASGAISCIPAIGTLSSIPIDLYLLKEDLKRI